MNKYIHTTLKGTLTAIMLMVGISAWAEDPEPTYVAQIGEQKYETLQAAITAATEGQTVTLIADISETATYTIDGKQITIDLGTYTITASHNDASSPTATKVFDIQSTGSLTITGTGGIKDEKVSAIFYNAGTLTINSGNYTTTTDDYGVVVNDGGTCTVNGGTLTGAYAAIYSKGTNNVTISNGTLNGTWIGIQANAGTTLVVIGGTINASNLSKKLSGIQLKGEGTVATITAGTISGYNGVVVLEKSSLTVSGTANIRGNNIAVTGNGDSHGTIININGGTITNDNDVAIYHPQDGTLTIAGGTITGTTALEVRSGAVSITGGTFTATASEYTCKPNGDGNTTVGAALAIAQHTTKKNINVNIEGGTFTGIKAINEANPEGNPTPQIALSVTAGDFTGEITTVDVEHFISGGTYSEAVPATYCVEGKAPYVDDEGHCTIVTTETAPADAEALSNGSYYKVLGNAITAASTEPTEITVLKDPAAEAVTILAGASITLAVANEVELTKPITNNGTLSLSGTVSGAINNSGTLTITSGATSGAITIAAFEATVKIASGVTSTSAIALSTELQTENVLKSSTTKEPGYTTYWVEKKVKAEVSTEITDQTQKDAAVALVTNTSISTVTGLAANQSLTIAVTSVTLGTDSKVTKATFEVKLIDTDGEVIENVDPAVTFHLPVSDGLEGKWANLWHDGTAIPGMNVVGASNGYVSVKTTSFSPFSYEIIENPIAQIEKTKYASVAFAIDDVSESLAKATEIILVGTEANVAEAITVGTSKNVELTIGAHTISGALTNNGTLALADGTISGTISNTGTLSVSGEANITGAVTASEGTLTISGGTFGSTITTSGTAGLTISDGTMNGALSVGGSGTNTISGGTISGAVATNTATTISGGEITNNITNSATLTITDGTFTGTITNTGTVAISGGTHTVLPVPGFCATGYMPIKNEADKYNMTNHWTITDATVIDGSHFEHLTSANGYKVATATYYRNTGMVSAGNAETMYGTICLPFEIKAAPTGMTLYKATEISGSTLTITAVTYTEPVAAGTPLIFELVAKASNMTVTSTDGGGIAVNTTTPTIPTDANLLRGKYTEEKITANLENIYYLNGDKFHQAKVSLTVPAYRAYIYYQAPAPSPAPSMLSIVKEGDEETAIQQIESLETVTEVYDLNGHKLNSLQRGVNIMRRADGSTIKVIVK